MWVLLRLSYSHVCEFNIQILVNRVELATENELILKLHRDVLTRQRFEEGEEVLQVEKE